MVPRQPAAQRNLLKPDWRINSVLDIDLDQLRERGIRGLIFDLDDTLVCSIDAKATPDVCSWIESVRDEFRIYVVSNNVSHERVHIAAAHMALPFMARAQKPSRRFFKKALGEMALKAHEVAIVGDQLFTDVLGGNRLGAMTILVDPLSAERKWHRKVMRRLETQMLRGHQYHPTRPRHPSVSPEGHAPHAEPAPRAHAHHPSMDPGPHHH